MAQRFGAGRGSRDLSLLVPLCATILSLRRRSAHRAELQLPSRLAEDLLAYQAGVFAVDVGNYSLLSNHAHNILRTRPDIAHTWSPEELALRWKRAWPEFRDGQWVREPTDQELEALLGVPEKLEKIRRNLSSLSWFMGAGKSRSPSSVTGR